MSHFEYIIQAISVTCPSCNEVFATHTPFRMSEMMPTSPIEADLHRVLPYGSVRACLVSICPQCQYSWWTNTFNRHYFLPVGISETPVIENPKKFAHAILTGRKNNYHMLDRALLALNGYWCAKESNMDTAKWLTLAIQELNAALAVYKSKGNYARYEYVLAELLRLNGQFQDAINLFNLITDAANIPEDLIENQKNLAAKKNNEPVLLNIEQVLNTFFPKLAIEIAAQQNAMNTEQNFQPETQNPTEENNQNAIEVNNQRTNLVPPKKFKAIV